MHFHGVHYRPSSDGAYVPGFSGRDAESSPAARGPTADAGRDSAGVWPYHDHSPVDDDSIDGRDVRDALDPPRGERLPDREYVVVFSPIGEFQSIDGRAFVGNTPVFRARAGDLVQWDVMAMGSEHHTFHVHGHRWHNARRAYARHRLGSGRPSRFRVRWRSGPPAPGCTTATSRRTWSWG